MNGKNKLVDGLIFKDDDDQDESVIFNYLSWVEIIKAIIMKYGDKNLLEVESLIRDSKTVNSPICNYMDVMVLCHESEYFWAMLIVHGDQYWLKGVSPHEPDGYFEWAEQYRKDHNLAAESFVFSD
ncbi:hypothetical protein [Serratia fonticola]|jgi:hypothetical protein|uniref:Uncharacterized protein n=1 Tax=Serratia fonticola TaxID=47917 RepID=A0A3S4WYF9_SERFO|nr:hypothetical protein [Serratia fonticola]CAI0928755.1 Uncharacterised protein [Serratia fonticola]CAI1803068.1 Uncharacterised protein [Serratia fonticola]VEI68411.1 Uncharacterised protein [Serratia fonticola]